MSEYSPASDGDEHRIFLAHDLRLSLESEMWERLQMEYEEGRMTQQEIEDAYMDWIGTHDDVTRDF